MLISTRWVIQGLFSVNPFPLDNTPPSGFVNATPRGGFKTFNDFNDIYATISGLLRRPGKFFSGMKDMGGLGRIIDLAAREPTYEAKGEKFLQLLRGV